MLCRWATRRENEAIAGDAGSFCMAAQITGIWLRPFEQPQHTAGHQIQNARPACESIRRKLVALIEIAKNKTGFRQAGLAAGRRGSHGASVIVIGLVATG